MSGEAYETPEKRPADRPVDVNSPAELRCSDVDRERVAEALRQAAGEGRLTLTELEERLDATFKARTYGDLQPITRDLPQGPYPMPSAPTSSAPASGAASPEQQWHGHPGAAPSPPTGQPRPMAPRPGPGVPARKEQINAILGEEKRRGRWEVPARLDVVPILGSVELDFTEAVVRAPEVEIRIGVVLGGVTIVVPEGIDVRMDSITNVLGERKMKLDAPVTPGAPVLRISGFVMLGEVTVRPPKKGLFR
ncbi:DUF1707 SHOCT-like domain-containing protein [Phytoactinopolyspora halotolerans]|uniref:DUF1707 domain-containing protein n=1 Tax=Phytoactinopolyspora halotolerans TaxID=1981512 RepID=A0A6L9S766_9ACTN|nr:DUF1707 domain-containing protein [Phytoactinopolyspora halotolerans]NED99819.1 DUF1707 domain-containing protein [Phytoactinopolyspora halotolerans]